MRDDVARPEQRKDRRQGRRGLADVNHDRHFQRIGHLTRAAHGFQIVFARDRAREPSLDSDDPLTVALDGAAGGSDIRALDVEQLADPSGRNPKMRDVQENPHMVRRALRDLHQRVHIIGATGAGVDQRRDSVL